MKYDWVRSLIVKIAVLADPKGAKVIEDRLRTIQQILTGIKNIAVKAANVMRMFVESGAGLEAMEIKMGTLARSMELGKEKLEELNHFAAHTPFMLHEVRTNTGMLLAMGIALDDIIPTMTLLGNVTAGLPNLSLERLALSFGQVKSRGFMTGQVLRNMARGGVPILESLAEVLGKTRGEIQEMVPRRMISFDMMLEAFEHMNSSGGRFHNLLDRMTHTTIGLYNNIKVTMDILKEGVGRQLLDDIKPLLREILDYMYANREEIIVKVAAAVKTLLDFTIDLYKVMLLLFKLLWPIAAAMLYLVSAVLKGISAVGNLANTFFDAMKKGRPLHKLLSSFSAVYNLLTGQLDEIDDGTKKTSDSSRILGTIWRWLQSITGLLLSAAALGGLHVLIPKIAAGFVSLWAIMTGSKAVPALLAKAFTKLGAALIFMLKPLVFAVIPILLLQDLWMALRALFDEDFEAETSFGRLFDWLDKKSVHLAATVKTIFTLITLPFLLFMSLLNALFGEGSFVETLSSDPIVKKFNEWLSTAKDFIVELAKYLLEKILTAFVMLGTVIYILFHTIASWIRDAIVGAFEFVFALLALALAKSLMLGGILANTIKAGLHAAWEWIKSSATKLLGWLLERYNSLARYIPGLAEIDVTKFQVNHKVRAQDMGISHRDTVGAQSISQDQSVHTQHSTQHWNVEINTVQPGENVILNGQILANRSGG